MGKKCFALLLCILLYVQGTTVFAYGEENGFTVSFRIESVSCKDTSFKLYHIADVSDTKGFVLTQQFQGAAISFQNLDEEQWKSLAQRLTGYIERTRGILLPTAECKTDENGIAKFKGLPAGLYLIVGESYETDSTIYTPVPFLVELPKNNMEIITKYTMDTRTEPTPKPSTGDWKEYSLILFLLSGILLVVSFRKLTFHR